MKISLKSKLMVLALAPIMVILALATGRILYDISARENLETTKKHILETEAVSKIIHYLQMERGLSIGFIINSEIKNDSAILSARQKVNDSIEEIKKLYQNTNENDSALTFLSDLDQKRALVDSLSISTFDVTVYFEKTIKHLIDIMALTPPLNRR